MSSLIEKMQLHGVLKQKMVIKIDFVSKLIDLSTRREELCSRLYHAAEEQQHILHALDKLTRITDEEADAMDIKMKHYCVDLAIDGASCLYTELCLIEKEITGIAAT